MKIALMVTILLGCMVPPNLHPVCERAIEGYLDGRFDIDHVIFACNMVNSKYIPMVECFNAARDD